MQRSSLTVHCISAVFMIQFVGLPGLPWFGIKAVSRSERRTQFDVSSLVAEQRRDQRKLGHSLNSYRFISAAQFNVGRCRLKACVNPARTTGRNARNLFTGLCLSCKIV